MFRNFVVVFLGLVLVLSPASAWSNNCEEYNGKPAIVTGIILTAVGAFLGVNGQKAKNKRQEALKEASSITDRELRILQTTNATNMNDGGGRRITSWVLTILGGLTMGTGFAYDGNRDLCH